MIFGIGSDIVAVERIERLWDTSGERFAKRILTPQELALMEALVEPVGFLAKRFAAKEALSKALGTGIGEQIAFHDISVLKAESGQPYVIYSDKAQALLKKLNITKTHVSLSDEKDFALAFVLLETS